HLAGVQSFRFAGVVLLVLPGMGVLPGAFAAGGYGDLTVGILGVVSAMLLAKGQTSGRYAFWALTLVGLADLLNVAYLLLAYYPIWFHQSPSSAAAASFSLVTLPALAAPIALLFHFYGVRNVLVGRGLAPSLS